MIRAVRLAVAGVAAVAALASAPAHGQNRGVYPLGMSATNSGVTAAAGVTFASQLLFYSRDRAKDDGGATLPTEGANGVLMGMNTLTWAAGGGLLGARYSASATIPIASNNLSSTSQGSITGGTGLADSFYVPVSLGWERPRSAIKVMYGFLAPTGRFTAGASDNVGSGYWTHTLSSGQTVYLTAGKRLVLSAFEMYEIHTEQQGTGVRPGDTLDIDYSLLGTFPATATMQVQVGLVGYEARQMTAKTGPEVTTDESGERYGVNAIGFVVQSVFPTRNVSVGVKYFKEFANRSTYEGYSVQVFGAVGF